MAVFIAQNLAPIMFMALVVFLLLGYPVAFALAANGLLFFFVAVELAPYAPETINLSWPLLQALPDRIYGTMSSAPAWPRTCSTPSGSCSAPSAAVWPMR
jgi:TRAP-type mannitol/chloroaromatic compound transport system permease large subunit